MLIELKTLKSSFLREVQNVESEKRKLANQKFQAGLRVCYTRFYSFEFCHRIFRQSILPFLILEFMVRYIMRCNSCRSRFLRSVTFRFWILASKTIFWILAKYKTIVRNRENLWALTDSYLSRNNSKYYETAPNIHRILIPPVFFKIYLQEKIFYVSKLWYHNQSDFYSTPSTEGVESTRGNSVCLCVCVCVCP